MHNHFYTWCLSTSIHVCQRSTSSRIPSWGLPRPCLVTQTCVSHFFLLKLSYTTYNCAYINIFIPICCLQKAVNVDEGHFLRRQEPSNVARCLNRSFSQPSMSTGTESELWIAVGLWLCMVEGRYHVTAWSRFYPFSITYLLTYLLTPKEQSPSWEANWFCS